MKKIVRTLVTACLIAVSLTSFSQKGGRNIYNWALGFRGEYVGNPGTNDYDPGSVIGPSFKYLWDPQRNIEIMYLTPGLKTGGDLHLMVNIFNPFPELPQNFRYYFGLGAHGGRWKTEDIVNETYYTAGVDGQLGLEIIGRKIPLALSIDWHPTYTPITKQSKSALMRFGLTLKYTYKR